VRHEAIDDFDEVTVLVSRYERLRG